MEYSDLSIKIKNNGDISSYSDQGDWQGKLDLDQNEIGLALQLIEEDRTNEDLLKKTGIALHNALFGKSIFAHFTATKAAANQNKRGVRLRLTFEKPEISSIPWEFLYDDSTNTFLANDRNTVLSRYIEVPLKKEDIKTTSVSSTL